MATDDDTQPSQRVDPRAEPPAQPKTIELDAVQVLSQLIKGVATDVKTSRDEAAANFVKVEDRLSSQDRKLDKVVTEGIEANVRMTRFEDRLERLENPSHPPPPPMTSTGIKALIDGHPSSMDLNLQAAQAAEIIKNQERDKKIEETHALAAKAAEVLAQQSDYMGMGKKGAQWLFSEKGRTAMAQAAAGLVAAYEVLKHGGLLK